MSQSFTGDTGNDAETVDTWWDQAHSKGDEGWLTGTPGMQEWQTLRVAGLVKPGTPVLNIGVGLGHGTLALAAIGCRVSALDISPVALDRVRDKVEAAYLASNLEQLPSQKFDLALSHLVAQHMSDDDLAYQLKHVMRSLTEQGLFAMQFATAWDQPSGTANDSPEGRKGGGVCRTLERLAYLAEAAGGRLLYAEMVGSYPRYRSAWYTAHIIPERGLAFASETVGTITGATALVRMQSERDVLTNQLALAASRQAQAEKKLQAILNSRSYRVTKPIRVLARVLRRMIGGRPG